MHKHTRKLKIYSLRNIERLPQWRFLTSDEQFAMRVVAQVFPFRVNNYVLDELIDWSNIPDDPIFRLTFMHEDMIQEEHFELLASAMLRDVSQEKLNHIIKHIRKQLNPHPAGQMTANVPLLDGSPVSGLQHKYRETCLVFPSQGQTCHSYCSFCFRWPQFSGMSDLKFATDECNRFLTYIRRHKEITDILFTGGDPMVMSARHLGAYIEPLLEPECEHIQSIRIGTKSASYWPYRYVSDKDSDDVLRLFDRVAAAGKHLAIMAHYNHWKELSTSVAREAVHRIRSTGTEIRTQSPLIRHVNDDPAVWSRMWKEQVRLGCIPYYMFVERDTGASQYFSVPLHRAWEIYQEAYQTVSGLSRTVRGPSMSAYPGKVTVDGIANIYGKKVFVLSFLQARVPDFVKRPFFAKFDEEATWLTDLQPAFGGDRFFFEDVETNQYIYSRRDECTEEAAA